jgi:TonB family protein
MRWEAAGKMNLAARAGLASAILITVGFVPNVGKAVEQGKEHGCYYPVRALKRHAEGTVSLLFQVSVDGHVQDISVQESSGDLALDHTAVACAENWRYLPAHLDGKPIAVRWKAKVVFSLSNPTRVAEAPNP